MRVFFCSAQLVLAYFVSTVAAIPYDDYILAPRSRTIHPQFVYSANGTIINSNGVTSSGNGSTIFHGPGSITYSYQNEIGGLVSLTVGNSSTSDAAIGLTFAESPEWISTNASDCDLYRFVSWLPVGEGPGTYTLPRTLDYGGFKYLTLILNNSAAVEIKSISTNFTPYPIREPRDYTGYFHCNEELLNRIWYAGAYTVQLCTIDPTHGNSILSIQTETIIPDPWLMNLTITNGTSALVDGAKRDRIVWPGDMVISIPTAAVSTYQLDAGKNSLDSLLSTQSADGMLPYAGYPFSTAGVWESFTYHLHTLISVCSYVQYSGDVTYLQKNWDIFTKAMAWSLSFVDDSGLANVTISNDWYRVGMSGHNIEANAILYHTLTQGIQAAQMINKTSYIANWTSSADHIKSAANGLLWNSTTGLYHDNETTLLSPQDGNAWAVKANLTLNNDQKIAVSEALKARWGPYGAPAPEGDSPEPNTQGIISPFIGGIEAETHFLASKPESALDLFRLEWGFMMDDPRMTNSTLIEGYSTDGELVYYSTYDYRLSHAHGWSTAPTYLLSTFVAGLKVADGGKTWSIAPQLGNLTSVQAGFSTVAGNYEVDIYGEGDGLVTSMTFCTPIGTLGSVNLPGQRGILNSTDNAHSSMTINDVVSGLRGGCWSYTQAVQ